MKTICATVTGKVIECIASEGDQIQIGDEILKIESMKMEIPVESEISGKVMKILVQEGDDVEEGQPVAELN